MKRLFLSLCLILFAPSSWAQFDPPDPAMIPPESLHERVVMVPGDPDRPVRLEVTIYTPPGDGPFPLAVVNHGATNASAANRGTRSRYTYAAFWFLSRGYAVALPMARGFSRSGGNLVSDGCHLDKIGRLNARDIQGVIAALTRDSTFDRNHIVVTGQSFGGWTTMALGMRDIPGVHALIGFSPALRSSDCGWQDQAMIATARGFGLNARYPSLWIYGDNDSIMPTAAWHAVFQAYAAGSKQAELLSVGKFMKDSHQLLSFPEGLAIWGPRADAFLAKTGMPSGLRYAGYLPLPTPPPSGFAALDDAGAVPGLTDKGRQAYRDFLNRPLPRVFLIARNSGSFVAMNGGFDPLGRGLAACTKAGIVCAPYAVDTQVVWTGGKEAPRQAARTVEAGKPAPLNFAYAVNGDCSSKGLMKITVTRPPEHGTVLIGTRKGNPGFPPGSPFAVCNTVPVQGVIVIYTSEPDFTGPDSLTFEETSPDGRRQAFEFALTVK